MHVRVCVDCGEEYRPEIVTCADCGGRLEDRDDDGDHASPASPQPVDSETPDTDFTHTVLHAEKATELTRDADRLLEAGIRFRLRPGRGTGYRLLVTSEDSDRALALLGLLVDGTADDDGTSRSCPACETPMPAEAPECPECGLAVGDETGPACERCGRTLHGSDCPDCGH